MADLKVLCELSYPPWIFQVRNYFSVYRLFPIVTPLFDIVDLSLVSNASSVGHYRGVMPDLREFTGDNTPFKWQRSHFYAHPRSSSLPNPCQDEECQQRARQTSDNVVLLPKDLEPLCHSLLSTKLNSRLP